jgi:hypothetical protein
LHDGLANPSLSTSLSATSIYTGQSVYDTAALSGETSNAGGSVTYFYSSSSSCWSPNPLYSQSVAVSNGNVPYSNSVTFNSAGTYYWYAQYTGDSRNNPAQSPCEPLTVTNPPSYYLTMNEVNMGNGFCGIISPSSGYYSGQVTIRASWGYGCSFRGWSGSGSGSYTGSASSATITMNGPITETATFYCRTNCAQTPTR